ncbi:MAG: hypothetical protein ABIE43_02295 [Patescibacteria group bacterium]
MGIGSMLGLGGTTSNPPSSSKFNRFQKLSGEKLKKTYNKAMQGLSYNTKRRAEEKLEKKYGAGYEQKFKGKSFNQIDDNLRKAGVSDSMRKEFKKRVGRFDNNKGGVINNKRKKVASYLIQRDTSVVEKSGRGFQSTGMIGTQSKTSIFEGKKAGGSIFVPPKQSSNFAGQLNKNKPSGLGGSSTGSGLGKKPGGFEKLF